MCPSFKCSSRFTEASTSSFDTEAHMNRAISARTSTMVDAHNSIEGHLYARFVSSKLTWRGATRHSSTTTPPTTACDASKERQPPRYELELEAELHLKHTAGEHMARLDDVLHHPGESHSRRGEDSNRACATGRLTCPHPHRARDRPHSCSETVPPVRRGPDVCRERRLLGARADGG